MTALSAAVSATSPSALAPPSHAAPPHAEGVSLLRLSAGGEVLAVPIDEVREILQLATLTPLPRTPAFVRGVMNLRGAVVPVIDLAARLGLAATVVGRRSCIVVVDARQRVGHDPAQQGAPVPMGLLVDAVFEVFDRQAAEIEPVPTLGTRVAPACLSGMTRARGDVIGVLALARVLSAAELADAIAAHQQH